MGGSFDDDDEAEHNVRSDAGAAGRVFRAAIPTVVTGLDATRRITIGAGQVAQIAEAGKIGRAPADDIDQWWTYWNETWNVPHDPVAVLTLVSPTLFELSALGHVRVETGGAAAGVSHFEEAVGGATRIVKNLDADREGYSR